MAFLVPGCSARAPVTPLAPADSVRVERLAPGVTHEYRWHATGPWAVHSLIIEPRTCGLQFRTLKALDQVIGRETTSAMAQRAGSRFGRPVLAALNADFFSYEPPGVSEGPQISNGALIKSEGTHREAVEDRVVRLRPVAGFTSDGAMHLTHTRLRGNVLARAFSVPLGGVNVPVRADDAFLFDALYGDSTPAGAGVLEVRARTITTSGSSLERAGIVTGSDTAAAGVAIPRDGFVVASRGSAQRVLATLSDGDTVRIVAAFDSLPANLVELIGGYPMLLVNGQHVHHQETGLRSPFSDRRHPRSAIGLDRNGNIHLIAVDGRQPGYSEGMSLQELGDHLLSLGIDNALNFDGGGSTTLVVAGRVANRPSDPNGERAVANALLLLGPRAGDCRR